MLCRLVIFACLIQVAKGSRDCVRFITTNFLYSEVSPGKQSKYPRDAASVNVDIAGDPRAA